MFEVTAASSVLFSLSSMFLLDYAYLDIRDRRVPNNLMYVSAFFGFFVITVTGHLLENLLLHISALGFMVLVSFLLFRIGSIGGADFKALLVIAMTSPGILFASWSDPVFEGIIAGGLEVAIMLLLGLLYSRISKPENRSDRKKEVPLLPLLLIAYLAVQLLALA
ncbi:MAG: prepilin peptidase [Promethearchaeota archaeon]